MFDHKNITIGKRVGIGFGIITLILMGVVFSTIQQVKTMEEITKRVIKLRTPTAHASLMMLNGINHSLAALRGWIILGDPKFKIERALAWVEQINPSLKQMQLLSSNWTNPENITRLKSIENEIGLFKKTQQEIEEIARTLENNPAQKILFDQAEPLEKIIVATVSEMIKLEMKHEMTPQNKRVVGILANIETTTSLALERADEYLLSGEKEFKKESLENWKKNKTYIEILHGNENLLSKEQLKFFQNLEYSLKQFGPLLKEIINIRSGEKWNIANHWLRLKVVPASFRMKEVLNDMTIIQEQLLKNDVEEISNRTHFLVVILVALFFTAALISGLLGANITRSISEPILEVTKIATELAHGNSINKRFPTDSKNEIGALSQSFNQLLDRLQVQDDRKD